MVLTHLLLVRDVDRSGEFYERVLEATVIREREPCVLRFQNGYIVLNTEGGPTDDKPDVRAQAPPNSSTLGSAMNVRVTDIHTVYEQWRSSWPSCRRSAWLTGRPRAWTPAPP
jgi:lactoylglutathione lyase